ncbi:MAG: ABC transporter ATP-binding protein [Armatimonadota bacterium]|nr:ABC transporter ATP-binding protein [Armatimonadota bacterium]MDR7531807.1 ABC transporter ATP-binding protein [Armatimonadota bacterium]MDR7534848.1 ABC transporter ATP-binding protein [Armatimonadota bacterium]
MLDVRQLHAYRGPAHVLRGVSLTVGEGEIVCLVGRNGAGKTTTLDAIMGLLPVRAGEISFRDRAITGLPPHARARLGLGYAPEDCGLFPDLTVAEHLAIGHWMAGSTRGDGGGDRVALIRTLFPELDRLMHRRGLLLSGGEKKMVAISRAMATGPTLLLLDEAFEGLAPVVVNRFADAVKQIKAAGTSLLVAESNVMTAARVADRLYVIDRGEIIFSGTPRQALADDEVMRTIRG